MQHFDYIFTGSGLAALLTVDELLNSGKFSDKTILLLDENAKKSNDRTWCFWDEDNLYETIISKKWSNVVFANSNFKRTLAIAPYQYKKINGLTFYDSIFKRISDFPNIQFLQEKVLDFEELEENCVVKTSNKTYSCSKIFNSIFSSEKILQHDKFPLIQQHFIGWFVKTETTIFDENVATFMDFSVNQNGNTRFMYVLPTSPTEALVEYTLFSKDLLPKKEYEDEIKWYLKKLGVTSYKIIEKEQGNIPMTSYPFWKQNTKNIIHIGSAGGWTKASTGFTFKNALKKSKALVKFLDQNKTNSDFRKFQKINKYWFYDLLLLDILNDKNHLGSSIFSSMFKKENPIVIFKFLDEQTSLWEDLQVIWRCPKMLFAKALLGRLFHL
jgi:lycopene beta-cyclase